MLEGRETTKPRGGRRVQKLEVSHKEAILDWIDADCTQTLPRLAERVFEAFAIRVCTKTVSRIFKEFHYSVKRISLIPERRNYEDSIAKRFEHAIFMLEHIEQREKIIYIDETGFNFTMRLRHGRSPIGTRANLQVPQIRSKNYSCAAAMTANGLFFFKVLDRPYNAILYKEYIIEVITKLRENGVSNAILVADNVAFHRGREVAAYIEASGHHMSYVPPYSPFLNPIEELFSKWKRNVAARAPASPEELLEAIRIAADSISDQDCSNFVSHAERYFPACLRREVIEN